MILKGGGGSNRSNQYFYFILFYFNSNIPEYPSWNGGCIIRIIRSSTTELVAKPWIVPLWSGPQSPKSKNTPEMQPRSMRRFSLPNSYSDSWIVIGRPGLWRSPVTGAERAKLRKGCNLKSLDTRNSLHDLSVKTRHLAKPWSSPRVNSSASIVGHPKFNRLRIGQFPPWGEMLESSRSSSQ